MKQLFVLVALFLSAATTCVAEEVPLLQNVLSRSTVSLNGSWHYIVDVQEEGYYDYRMKPTPWGFFQNAKPQKPEDLIEYDFDKAPVMQVPGDWNTQDERLFFYEGTVWFKRAFQWHRNGNRRTLLYFGAVNYDTYVYVNGKLAGHHVGGFTPFNFDVTDMLREGDNFVVLKVDNKRHAEAVPTQIFDWWNYGGITRDVLLVDVEPVYIEDYNLQLASLEGRLLSFSVQLNKPLSGQQITLSIPELKIKKTLTTDAEGKAALSMKAKPILWSPATPKLYQVDIQLGSESIRDEIGFRIIETRGKQILLNGNPIFLKGISIHEENEYAVREAERMGMLVWSEIPVYWTIAWTNADTYRNAERQLTDMIRRDHNRCNVIIWSIANETPHSDARDQFLSRLSQKARSLDATRLISMAMEVTAANHHKNRLQDNMNQYVDVISFNQYIGWYRDVNDAPKMEWEIPYDKPVIISEFGGGANLYRENCAMLDKIDGLAGTTPWILKDFRSPRRVLNGIQDYYNRKGLFSDDGHKKKAFYVLKEWYQGK